LVAHISNLTYEEAEQLPITQYRDRLEFALNWGNYLRGEKFEFLTTNDKQLELEMEHRMLFPEVWEGKNG